MPVADWLRGPLREWAEDLITSAVVRDHLNGGMIRTAWIAHQCHRRNNAYKLWDVVLFAAWAQAR